MSSRHPGETGVVVRVLCAQRHAECWEMPRGGQGSFPEGTRSVQDGSGKKNGPGDPEPRVLSLFQEEFSCGSLILCDLGQALSFRPCLQHEAIAGIRVFPNVCDFSGLLGNCHAGVCDVGRLRREGDKGLEMKVPWFLWGRAAGPGGALVCLTECLDTTLPATGIHRPFEGEEEEASLS